MPLRRELIAQSPHLPIVAFLVLVGVKAFVDGKPEEIVDAFPVWLTWTWGVCLTGGGLLAIGGCVTDRSRAESAGLALCLVGIVCYVLVQGDGWSSAVVLALMCASRLWVLHRARQAHREVEAIVGRQGDDR